MFRFQTLLSITSCAATSRALATCSAAPPRGWRSSSAPTKAGQSQGHPRAGSSKRNTLQVPVLGVAHAEVVTNMRYMFTNAAAFAQDITGWTATALQRSTEMFTGADAWLKQITRDSAAGGGVFDGPPNVWQ